MGNVAGVELVLRGVVLATVAAGEGAVRRGAAGMALSRSVVRVAVADGGTAQPVYRGQGKASSAPVVPPAVDELVIHPAPSRTSRLPVLGVVTGSVTVRAAGGSPRLHSRCSKCLLP